jgi:ribosomal protein S18 acetylase RimI-like enzyme
MEPESGIQVKIVTSWDADALIELYRAGGWWKEHCDHRELAPLIKGSFAFAVAVETVSGRTAGMGRIISDGVSDAYIQDLIVHPDFRKRGIGKEILITLLAYCREKKMTWISLIAEPGTAGFYYPLGFRPMKGYVPMIYREEEDYS